MKVDGLSPDTKLRSFTHSLQDYSREFNRKTIAPHHINRVKLFPNPSQARVNSKDHPENPGITHFTPPKHGKAGLR